jgi:hypothetical protein
MDWWNVRGMMKMMIKDRWLPGAWLLKEAGTIDEGGGTVLCYLDSINDWYESCEINSREEQ